MIEGKKISKLDLVNTLQDSSCFPVLARGATRRITFSALINNIIGKLPDASQEEIDEIKRTISQLEKQIEAVTIDNKEVEELIKDVNFTINGQNETILEYTSKVREFEQEIGSSSIAESVQRINGFIPSTATETNKLTDKEYVDNSIQTNSAVNRGNFDTHADLMAYSGTVTRNDYATVGDDETHDHECWRYKWNDDTHEWTAEYRINESPLTPAQLAAINSGITAEKVANIPDYKVAQIDDTKTDRNTALSSLEIHNRLQSTISDYLDEFKTHYYKAGIFENTRTSGNEICVDMSTVDDEWDLYDHEVLINFGMYEDGDHICGFYSDICGAYDSSTSLTPNSTSEFRCGGTTQTRQNNLQMWIPCHRYIHQHFSNACANARFNVMAWRRIYKG